MKSRPGTWMRIFCGAALFFVCVSVTEIRGDETALFTSVAPDALIVLDLSGSMNYSPAGGSHIWGNSSCSGTFYSDSGDGHSTNCSRLAIAKRALFDILDDNGNGTIDNQDENSLNIRIGYMRFRDGDDTGGNYSDGNIKLIWEIGSRYSRIYCNDATSCTSSSSASGSISGATADSGTPLASSLNEAKLYLDANKATDNAASCRQKFVIMITDGADTYACSGNGTEVQTTQYKRRRESVAKAKALADAGYKVFVIGFGSAMPDYLEKTLNWMAYTGGTDNPNVINSGSTTGYNPAGVTSCQDSTTTGNCDGWHTDCYAAANDPGNTALTGYAFLAADSDALSRALKATINIIREANYSFSQASVQSVRLASENFLYEGSFQPINNDSFWYGHLKKYQINGDGTVGSVLWDAGEILRARAASDRNIKTAIAKSLVPFATGSDQIKAALGVTDDTLYASIVGFISGDSTYNAENWKLGDIFRSTPITIGTPSHYYYDLRDTSQYALTGGVTGNAFAAFRDTHGRSSAAGNQVIVAGANDGQLHGFRTGTGAEAWSFIPPNLLPKLKNIVHTAHPTSLTHQYFVDGPVTVADAWLGSGTGVSKAPGDWKTLLISAEGRGATGYLWSSSDSCDSGMSALYNATTAPYYCGYHALDVTDPPNPVYKWRLNPSGQSSYMGDPWSKMMVGRVKNGSDEKWVGFIGAGYNASDCSGGGSCDTRGKGFLVVDLANGDILWSYTYSNSSSLAYAMPAPPAIVDTDGDGFIDTAYIGDLGGNVWRFKFCKADGTNCGSWEGGRLFQSSTGNIRPIYTTITVARDSAGSLWTYWSTGDKSDPTASNAQEKFFALKDNNRASTYIISDLENITSGTCNPESGKMGWYINLSGSGEKILSDPTVFGGIVYFTTYTPSSGGNPCDQSGSAKLYALDFTCGGGMFSGGARSIDIGTGIASAPVISLRPGSGAPDLFVNVSGGGPVRPVTPPGVASRTNLLFWRDRRVQ